MALIVDRGRYLFRYPEHAVTFTVERVREDRGDVYGEILIHSALTSGSPEVLYSGRANLMSTRSRTEIGRALAKYAPEIPNAERLVELVAHETVTAFRRGEPAMRISEIEPLDDEALDVLPPLAGRLPTCLFGDGGSGKSLLAIAAAASIQAGKPYLGLQPSEPRRVALLDWEMDGQEHRRRLEQLAGPEFPDLLYGRGSSLRPRHVSLVSAEPGSKSA